MFDSRYRFPEARKSVGLLVVCWYSVAPVNGLSGSVVPGKHWHLAAPG